MVRRGLLVEYGIMALIAALLATLGPASPAGTWPPRCSSSATSPRPCAVRDRLCRLGTAGRRQRLAGQPLGAATPPVRILRTAVELDAPNRPTMHHDGDPQPG
jgi:hypothetical protein